MISSYAVNAWGIAFRRKKLFLVLFVIIFAMIKPFAYAQENVKTSALAGSWYPAGKAELSRMLDGFLSGVKDGVSATDIMPENIGVLVSPHAGYVFSGPVAAYGFKAVQARKVSTVVILAPTHHVSFQGASVWADGSFVTPLGSALVDKDLAGRLLAADNIFTFRKDVFAGAPGRPENSVETQIPFIQKVFPGAKIVPVILGFPPDRKAAEAVAAALAKVIGERRDILIDVSVDQSHFHPLDDANTIDRAGLAAIEKFDIEGLWQGHRGGGMEVDGFHVVATAMICARMLGYTQAKILKYATSADVTGDASSVVGYASVIFYRAPGVVQAQAGGMVLSDAHKKRLLEIARTTLDMFVTTGKVYEFDEKDVRLLEEEGAFVTLKEQGRLRGCIGNIIGDGPLFKTVRDMAVAASSEDPRFNPVRREELAHIDVEVSVLSKPRIVTSADEIVMGTHGVIIRRGMKGGVFLPQVAAETGWSKERFLSELCSQKAGLPPECWKDPATQIEVFTAQVFGEKEQ